MSVYHSIRGSMQPGNVEEDVDEQNGLVVVDLNDEPEPEMHPALDRVSGQVCILKKMKRKINFNAHN